MQVPALPLFSIKQQHLKSYISLQCKGGFQLSSCWGTKLSDFTPHTFTRCGSRIPHSWGEPGKGGGGGGGGGGPTSCARSGEICMDCAIWTNPGRIWGRAPGIRARLSLRLFLMSGSPSNIRMSNTNTHTCTLTCNEYFVSTSR
jgi:hypothetical protein